MTIKKTVFTCDRRTLIKFSAAGAAAAMMVDLDAMAATGDCTKLEDSADISSQFKSSSAAGEELYYWIDGMVTKGLGGNLMSRARVATHVALPHSPASYVESVVLADSSLKLVASQRFSADQSIHGGLAPYAIFEDLELDASQGYSLFYVIRKSDGKSVIYRFNIPSQHIRPSRLDYSHLNAAARARIPAQFIEDQKASNSRLAGEEASSWGVLHTPYTQFALPSVGLHDAHQVRARLDLFETGKGGGTGFRIFAKGFHADIDSQHYMRYMLALDPVGRLVGGKRLTQGGDKSNVEITEEISGFSDASVNGPSSLKIRDCPYVQVIVDDIHHVVARSIIRIR